MPYFDNPPLIQSSKFNNSFGHVYSYAKIFLILYPPLENSTTRIAIMPIFWLTTLSQAPVWNDAINRFAQE